MPANAAATPSRWTREIACLSRRAAKITTNTGMVAAMMVPADADVPVTPKVCATCPTPIPMIPSMATAGTARHGRRFLPTSSSIRNGTASANRSAVRVSGGMVTRPSLVAGMVRPHIRASNSIAPRLPMEIVRAGPGTGGRTAGLETF